MMLVEALPTAEVKTGVGKTDTKVEDDASSPSAMVVLVLP